uniref:Enhancer of mRNA-decapping protein 4 n=1 Tax=Oncorhynchus mykiss TaxID=8022 RepID=A0A8C7R2E1_ONCMY
MASNSNIDIEGATQHLRDILKLDRPGNNVDASPCESQRKTSFNGELNGLLPGAGNRSTMDESTGPNSENMNTQECQIICLSGDDGSTCIPITSNNVEIVASRDSSIDSKARGSNKVKIQPVAKYDWEHKHYYGNLIAVSNSYLAYAIRGANNQAMIRVLSLGSAERTLLKGFTGAVTDLAFAHLDSTLLGCVDEAGNLVIWQLTLVVHIRRPEDTPLNSNRRLIWCPFILEDNEENPEDASQTLALLHEDRVCMPYWTQLDLFIYPLDATDLKDGVITIKGHTEVGTYLQTGALSPDGTVLATASHDGYVKFWQIYIEGQDQPRCLHEWQPHNGNPLSCLLFCDNHKKQDPDVPFWRFLITGADQNQELKMWCTVSWTCLQTIRFSPDPFNSSVLPSLKASLDLSAECLILSDVQRKVLYVMELLQDQEKGHASFTAVSEFLLTHPVLSFGVQDVSRSRLRHTEVLPPDEESESMTAEGIQGPMESRAGIQIKLYCVHTKSLQDVQIWFQPNLGSGSSLFLPHSNDGFGELREPMEGLSSDKESGCGSQNDLRKIPALPAPADFMSPTGAAAMPKLMTPDAFMTPSASVCPVPNSHYSYQNASEYPREGYYSWILIADCALISPDSCDVNVCRGGEELTQNPKMSVESSSSLTLSASTSSPRTTPHMLMFPLTYPFCPIQVLPSPNPPLSLDPQVIEPMLIQHASPTLARSPDVISSASTAMSQDIPEIASETLQRSLGVVSGAESRDPLPALHTDSMASAASALHHLSPRNRNNSDHGHLTLELVAGAVEAEQRLSNTPSLLENALSQENAAAAAAVFLYPCRVPIITTYCGHLNSSCFVFLSHSDHDDEVASLASSSGNCGARSSQRLPVKEWKSSPRGSPKLKRKSKKDDGWVMTMTMNPEVQEELLMLLRNQQRELADLRQSQLELLQRVTGHMDAVQSSVIAHVEHVMVSQQEHEQRRMERILAEGQNRNQQLQEHLSQQLAQTLNNTLCNRLDKTLREEMKKTVPPTIIKSLEPVTAQMNNTIAAKLTTVEAALKENVSKVVKSKNTTDAIGRAAAEAMQGPIQAAYKDAFQSIVLPVFERGCQSMFQQINDSFKQGTHEYIQQLETHVKSRKQHELEGQDPMIGQLQQMIDTFQSSTDQLATTVTASVRSEVQHQLNMTVGNLQESILTQVQRIVKGEVSMAMKEQQAAVTSSIMQAMRSAAGTPVPTPLLDYQAQQANILQLLQQGQLNQAFQQALSASDLNLVLYVCETIDSQQVFGQHPCPLIQPVLLSLIQQLSTNLATRSELKISYLEDAVMNLDHGDPVTRDHMSTVLSQVRQKLFQFLQQDPHSPLSKRARRLVMMLQGLVNH